jgi:hypothetical protein
VIEKALQLRAYLLKNPEMVVDSPTLKQMFMWLMDNYVVDSAPARPARTKGDGCV